MATVLIDTNLLILLIVGLTEEKMIGKHRRTREYDKESYDLLIDSLEDFSEILITPHILAETSNLIRQCEEPLKTKVGECLSELISKSEELQMAAATVVRRPEYLRIGLTDAGILQAQEGGATLLTDDNGLYLASLRSGHNAINFSHRRDLSAS